MAGSLPRSEVLVVLLLYSLGAHGIMTLNDFKAVTGDKATGVRSLPVTLGVRPAALLACTGMALAQMAVVALLVVWGLRVSALAVSLQHRTWLSGHGDIAGAARSAETTALPAQAE